MSIHLMFFNAKNSLTLFGHIIPLPRKITVDIGCKNSDENSFDFQP